LSSKKKYPAGPAFSLTTDHWCWLLAFHESSNLSKTMLLHCPRVQALLPLEKIQLEHKGPAWMHWTEHGGTLILRIADLKFAEIIAPAEKSGLFLKVELTPVEIVVHKIEVFAAHKGLILATMKPPASELHLQPILAACHVPQPKKFIFAEDSRLEVRPCKAGVVDLTVQGEFRARTVPCREADLVIHLTPGDLVQLLSFLLSLAGCTGSSP